MCIRDRLYIYSRFSTEVCEDDSRVFVLFVCDAFLYGVIGMHLFLFIITNVGLDPFKINRLSLIHIFAFERKNQFLGGFL